MPAGRPTKYTEELLEKARDYPFNYEEHGHAFPSDVGLADVLGITRTTIYAWDKESDKAEFSNILDQIEHKQQIVAWDKGLKGEYNANLVKLLLGKHGYSDKSDTTHRGHDGGAVESKWTVEFVNATSES